MGPLHAGVMPDSLQRIEVGGIRGEIVDLDGGAVVGEPRPDTPVFVVGGVVVDEVNLAGEVAAQNPVQVLDVGLGIEDRLEMVEEPGAVQLDGAEEFEGPPLARGRDFRLRAYPGPGLVEGGVLPEGGFVLEEEGGPFGLDFFLMAG